MQEVPVKKGGGGHDLRLKRGSTFIGGSFARKKDHSNSKQANMKDIEYQV